MFLGSLYTQKWGDHQKKEFLKNNLAEALFLFNEDHQGLSRLRYVWGKVPIWEGVRRSQKEGIFFEMDSEV